MYRYSVMFIICLFTGSVNAMNEPLRTNDKNYDISELDKGISFLIDSEGIICLNGRPIVALEWMTKSDKIPVMVKNKFYYPMDNAMFPTGKFINITPMLIKVLTLDKDNKEQSWLINLVANDQHTVFISHREVYRNTKEKNKFYATIIN